MYVCAHVEGFELEDQDEEDLVLQFVHLLLLCVKLFDNIAGLFFCDFQHRRYINLLRCCSVRVELQNEVSVK